MTQQIFGCLLLIVAAPGMLYPAGPAAGHAFTGKESLVFMAKSDDQKVAQGRPAPTLPLPRDPDIAVSEEFAQAKAQGIMESWQLFISRHGDHRLAAEARRELERLKQKNQR